MKIAGHVEEDLLFSKGEFFAVVDEASFSGDSPIELEVIFLMINPPCGINFIVACGSDTQWEVWGGVG